ncbi:MAG TPA: choline BCCT transporter BetT [Nocardioidaceae bacterium]|nr:choline BCCT transporter BetT [Nocardioidaceae bacterium]
MSETRIQRETTPPEEPDASQPTVNRPVLIGATAVIAAVTAFCIISPTTAESAFASTVGWATRWFGWFYIALGTVVLVFVLYLAMSRYGRIRLGPEHSRPEFTTTEWAAMLFAAGIGTDLMFFAVNEPVAQFLAPPSASPESVEAAREATVWTMFHYGITGWAMYALMGMALGYFAYRLNLPLAIRSALYPVFGKRIYGPGGTLVDIAAVVGTIIGVATSLGIGAVGLNVGLNLLFDIPLSLGAQIALVTLGIATATVSAFSGVDRGIKVLSMLNLYVTIGLAFYILVTGRTSFLLNAIVLNLGDFVRLFPEMTMQTFAFQDNGDWLATWTLFFWAWWVAWSAFIGLFLARISRGRTIREFVTGTLILPFTYTVMWVTIFGNAAIDQVRQGNTDFGELASSSPENGFYALLQEHPAFFLIAFLATAAGLLFNITSADSGALVMANLSSHLRHVQQDGDRRLRVFWALLTGALTVAVLSVGGILALQYATVIMGLPFAVVLVLVMVGLAKALRVEAAREDARAGFVPGLLSRRGGYPERDRPLPWKSRVRRVMHFPGRDDASSYLHTTAQSALTEVVEELRGHGADATLRLTESALPGDAPPSPGPTGEALDLHVPIGVGATPFRYRISHERLRAPVYGRLSVEGDDYYSRLEVFLSEDGQGYDVMDYSHAQLIDDVLDQYEQHLEYVRLHESSGG